jgi:hypothetical protein
MLAIHAGMTNEMPLTLALACRDATLFSCSAGERKLMKLCGEILFRENSLTSMCRRICASRKTFEVK